MKRALWLCGVVALVMAPVLVPTLAPKLAAPPMLAPVLAQTPAPSKPATAGRATGAATAGRRGGGAAAAPARKLSPGAGPVIRFETAKGAFEMETFPKEAPKTVEHILALVKRNFYNGHRIHRQVPGFVVQFGDPLSRDVSKKHLWGTGGSMYAIGVNEASPMHTHETGAVATAHPGDPRQADSQMYIMLAPRHNLDGDFTVFADIISGMDVVQKLAVGDVIRKATVIEPAAAAAK
jgi:cyclophilin family peptidyl-prolyl cis-trans isomerase